MTAVLTCFAALAVVPSAFAHHARISGSMDCQGNVTFTASAWQSSSTLGRTHNDVRVYVVQTNGATVSPAQQVGSGQFKSSNGFAFAGGFAAPALVTSLKLNVKEIGPWGNGTGSSNGTNPEASTVISRSTSGCTTTPPPPTDVCPNIAGNQASVPAGMIKDASGNCSTPPPPPTDECPNLAGIQTSVPAGMVKDSSGNCSTPPPPPPPPADECPNIEGIQTSIPSGMVKDGGGNCVTPPAALVASAIAPAVVTKTATPTAKVTVKKATKKKVVNKKKVAKKKAVKKQSTAAKTKPRALPFTP